MEAVEIDVRREPLGSAAAARLIAALDAELSSTYPEPGATHFRLDAEEVSAERGVFLVAYLRDMALGCGAVRLLDPMTAEIKRMYVAPDSRGLGIGRLVLAALEAEAHRLGASRIVLETGVRQVAALALYGRAGYRRTAAFGEYVGSSLSVCMEKRL